VAQWCFVHAADTHLDTPMRGLRTVDPALHQRILSASLDAFDDLVDLAIARDAAFLTIAGDVYDGAQRGARAQLRVRRGAERLAEHGILLLLVHGNHDPVEDGWDGIGSWPDNVTVFPPDEPTSVEVHRDGRLLAVVQGVSYATRREERNLARRFARSDRDVPHVAVLHANVGSNPDHAPYAPASLDDLAATGFDYWALGHVHLRQTLATPSSHGFWAHYPGNLQGRSPKPSERGAKGASVVPVDGGVVGAPELVVLDRVRFAEAAAEIDDGTTLDRLLAALADDAADALAVAEGRIVVLRGRITGAGPLHHQLAREGVLEDLRRALTDQLPTGDAVWASLRDASGPPVEADDVAQAVDVLDQLPVDQEALADAVLEQAARLGDEVPDRDALLAQARRTARALLQETAR